RSPLPCVISPRRARVLRTTMAGASRAAGVAKSRSSSAPTSVASTLQPPAGGQLGPAPRDPERSRRRRCEDGTSQGGIEAGEKRLPARSGERDEQLVPAAAAQYRRGLHRLAPVERAD